MLSLFTNVPTEETIEIIINAVYNHPTLPPPPLKTDTMRKLLQVCTSETPFHFCGKTYVQIDGVSIGSPLGPTFADFYMSYLENTLLQQQHRVSNPIFYVRYVDDILAIFKSQNHIRFFVNRLKSHSILNFTTEEMQNNKFHFLDIALTVQPNGDITTAVYVKPTDQGIYTNYFSHSPDMYKYSIIKTLVTRALKYSFSWHEFNVEITRLKQIFANNNFPQIQTEKIINKMLEKYLERPSNDANSDSIQYYVRLQNLSSFSSDSKLIRNIIIKTHVKPVDSSKIVSLMPFYRPLKLSSKFSTRIKHACPNRVNVVYQFNCSEPRGNAVYIGYTTCTLQNRCKRHRYKSSGICQHYNHDHSMFPPNHDQLINNFKILHSFPNKIDLQLAEAFEIKSKNPIINVKYNELSSMLGLFL